MYTSIYTTGVPYRSLSYLHPMIYNENVFLELIYASFLMNRSLCVIIHTTSVPFRSLSCLYPMTQNENVCYELIQVSFCNEQVSLCDHVHHQCSLQGNSFSCLYPMIQNENVSYKLIQVSFCNEQVSLCDNIYYWCSLEIVFLPISHDIECKCIKIHFGDISIYKMKKMYLIN